MSGDTSTILWSDFRINEWERWDWYRDSRQLIFSHEDEAKVVADIIFVDTSLTTDQSWMWAWANHTQPAENRAALTPIRAFGEAHNLLKLAGGYWHGDEDNGWLMTAFACEILDGVGGYRTPAEHGYTDLVIRNAGWAQ